ncbi:MAG: 4-hydroxythreonine-4-phosphate dehydrogenase PdxA [Synechococcus sp. ELA057]
MNPSKPRSARLAIALGDPAGIGAEVTLKALARWPAPLPVVLVGCRRWLEQCHDRLRHNGPLADPRDYAVHDLPLSDPVQLGRSTAAAGDAGFRWLTAATELVLKGYCGALVTAPIAKSSWHAAGHHYPGQTERLAELAGVEDASMLFTALAPGGHWRFNTLLATTHIPLAQVPRRLDPALVQHRLDVLLRFCQRFEPRPTLAVAGLNPHAGEGGALGSEEHDWLEPCLEAWRQRHPQVTLLGPLPPDSCWLSAARAWQGRGNGPDGYLALYHDQGLIPVKLLAFDAAVNTTLGLPFLRTSPDHGTAFEIAGKGVARAESMVAAIETALTLGLNQPLRLA